MQKMLINSDDTKDFFVQAFKSNKLIPILGSGFSCGMPARDGNHIPSGKDLKKFMIKTICKERKEFNEKKLKEKNFSWISERFFKCDLDKIIEYFYKNFTGVKFTGTNKRIFLNEIAWPYIYIL